MQNNYKSFSLFNDVEDAEVRNYNRARILFNIMEDNYNGKEVTVKGAALAFGYFEHVANVDKVDVTERLKKLLAEKGMIVE